jgi:hypothetical protein
MPGRPSLSGPDADIDNAGMIPTEADIQRGLLAPSKRTPGREHPG